MFKRTMCFAVLFFLCLLAQAQSAEGGYRAEGFDRIQIKIDGRGPYRGLVSASREAESKIAADILEMAGGDPSKVGCLVPSLQHGNGRVIRAEEATRLQSDDVFLPLNAKPNCKALAAYVSSPKAIVATARVSKPAAKSGQSAVNSTVSAQVSQLNQKIDALETELGRMRQVKEDQKGYINQLEGKVENLNKINQALFSGNTELDVQVVKLQKDIKALEERYRQLAADKGEDTKLPFWVTLVSYFLVACLLGCVIWIAYRQQEQIHRLEQDLARRQGVDTPAPLTQEMGPQVLNFPSHQTEAAPMPAAVGVVVATGDDLPPDPAIAARVAQTMERRGETRVATTGRHWNGGSQPPSNGAIALNLQPKPGSNPSPQTYAPARATHSHNGGNGLTGTRAMMHAGEGVCDPVAPPAVPIHAVAEPTPRASAKWVAPQQPAQAEPTQGFGWKLWLRLKGVFSNPFAPAPGGGPQAVYEPQKLAVEITQMCVKGGMVDTRDQTAGGLTFYTEVVGSVIKVWCFSKNALEDAKYHSESAISRLGLQSQLNCVRKFTQGGRYYIRIKPNIF